MGLKRLSAKCRACPKVETCDHKRMEALGYLPEPAVEPIVQPNVEELTTPLVNSGYIEIKESDIMNIAIMAEEIKRKLDEQYKFGAAF